VNGLSLPAEIAYRREVTDRAAALGIRERDLMALVELRAAIAEALGYTRKAG